jgi:hypothetical protein
VAYTLSDARDALSLDYLDDTGATQWPTAALDRHLRSSLSMCVEEYASNGGSRLNSRTTGTTSSTGALDLSATAISSLRKVARVYSDFEVAIDARPENSVRYKAQDAIDLAIYYTPAYVLPTTAGHPLVGDGATEAPGAWDAFCDWVCVRAAIRARVSRSQQAPVSLVQFEAQARANVLDADNGVRMGRLDPIGSSSRTYTYVWLPSSRTIQLSVGGRRGQL